MYIYEPHKSRINHKIANISGLNIPYTCEQPGDKPFFVRPYEEEKRDSVKLLTPAGYEVEYNPQ